METIAINGTVRQGVGKKATKALRKEGQVPCVIYGGDEVIHFSSAPKVFKHLIYTPDFKLADVTIDGQTYQCILKDSQFHPVTDEIVHLDFLRLIPGKKIKVNIPIGFKGESEGVKGGGTLAQKLRTISVKTTPDKIVNRLFVDITGTVLGSSVRVKDIEVAEGMEVMQEGATPVATIEVPRALRSAEDDAEAKEGGAVAAESTEAAAE